MKFDVEELNHNHIQHNIKRGFAFGYPRCCVANFVQRYITPNTVLTEMNKLDERKLHGTGYVPCYMCNQEYTEEELINNINSNRTHEKPFPLGR